MTFTAPAEWPAELTPPGKRGATRHEALDRSGAMMSQRKMPSTRRGEKPMDIVRAPVAPALIRGRGQQMEDILFAEAEEEARLRRWRRRQLEAL